MVEFLTLFLGLAHGPQIVELDVVGPVAEVEIRLDGEELVTLTAPPWVLELDLGEELLPHDLVAIARDGSGRVLDRAERWINLSISQAAARMDFTTDAQGRPEAVGVVWEGIGQTRLQDVEIEFDGRRVTVDDPEHVPLPPHETDEFHYVTSAVHFDEELTDRLETDYGGARGSEISAELTAVAVILDRRSLPSANKMRDWFVKDGQPLKVHGIEKGDAELVVVRAPGTQETLDDLATAALTSLGPRREPVLLPDGWEAAEFFGGAAQDVVVRVRKSGRDLEALRHFARLNRATRLRFVSPRPGSLSPRGIEPESFVRSRDYDASEGGFAWMAQQQPPMVSAPEIAEAVAMAGVLAHSSNSPRAVLLILAGDGEDHSKISAEIASGYLRAVGVPLVVWNLGSETSSKEWEGVVALGDPSSPQKLLGQIGRAVTELQKNLRKQRVVWLEGRHLPQRIELGTGARGIRLAGS